MRRARFPTTRQEEDAMTRFENYASKYECAELERDDGILTIRLHTKGGPLVWDEVPHRELGFLFADVGADAENRVAILTGTGDVFCRDIAAGDWDLSSPQGWDPIYWEGRRLIQNHIDMPVPMIAAVNGPAVIHAELALLCDVVLAADTTEFQDAAHFKHHGAVPGDGCHLIWPLLLGLTRGRYFLLTGQKIDAEKALEIGIVNEVLPMGELMDRARALAREIASQPPLTVRYTRVAMGMMLRTMLADSLSHGLALEGLSVVENQRPQG